MSVSILVVDDESDVAELFRQHFRREARQAPMSCISPLLVRKHSTSLPSVLQHGRVSGSGAAGTSNSTNVRLTRRKSTLFQWLAIPLWVPTGKDSVPTDSGGIPL